MDQHLNLTGGGELTLIQEGPRVRLDASRDEDGQGLYKVWIRGAGGGRYLAGTLVPEGGRLTLRRTLSVAELQRTGAWPVIGADAVLAFPFSRPNGWYCESAPGRLISDPLLQTQLSGSLLCCRNADGFRLAVPLRPECPLPLTSLFCLARPEPLNGQLHLIWSFDSHGRPLVPE